MSVAIALDDAGASPEAEILRRVRDGDDAAFAVLYERHVGSARRLARSILRSSTDVDDVVSEVFAASFAAIRKGKGPVDALGPYVLTSVRRECYRSWRRGARRNETPEGDAEPAATDVDDPEERAVLEQAFTGLAPNLRSVLWLTEVEGLSHAEVAGRTGSTSQAVAVMAMRARRSLAERYLQAHVVGGSGRDRECQETRRGLARLVRGTASRRQQRRVSEHLADCPDCEHAEEQLRQINQRLRTIAPPASLALVASRLVATGLRARLGAWLLAPAAPLTAATTLLVAGMALPASSTGAEPSTTDGEPVVVQNEAEPAVMPAPAVRRPTTALDRTTSRVPGVATGATAPTAAEPVPTGAPPPVEPAPLVTLAPALPGVPPVELEVPSPVEVDLPLPDVDLGVTVTVPPAVPLVGATPVDAQVTTGADGVGADIGVGPVELDVELGADGVDVAVDGAPDLVDSLLPGG